MLFNLVYIIMQFECNGLWMDGGHGTRLVNVIHWMCR
jgi:hypothetical protein